MKERNVSKLEFWRAMFYTGEGYEKKNKSEGGNKDLKELEHQVGEAECWLGR